MVLSRRQSDLQGRPEHGLVRKVHGTDTLHVRPEQTENIASSMFRHRVDRRVSQGLSKGCITVVNPLDFARLERHIRSRKPSIPIPGETFNAYGKVMVR